MTAVKYHGGRNYKNRINKHTPNRRNNHPRNPPTPTPKPSLSIPLRSLATHASSGYAYRGAPCPLAATCAAALPCHASAAASRRDARARVMASRSIAPPFDAGQARVSWLPRLRSDRRSRRVPTRGGAFTARGRFATPVRYSIAPAKYAA